MSGLADCPFCGGKIEHLVTSADKLHPYRIVCNKCGGSTANYGDMHHCIAAWSRRPEPAPQDNAEIVERLTAERDGYKRVYRWFRRYPEFIPTRDAWEFWMADIEAMREAYDADPLPPLEARAALHVISTPNMPKGGEQ